MNLSLSTNLEKRAAALIIVLAFLVLLSGIVVAYLARTGTDRQLAHGTYSETRADLLARSALDLIAADLKQEIVNGSASPAPTFGPVSGPSYLYTPTTNTYIVPSPDGTPSDKSIPNLVKRSVRSDNPGTPGVGSRASAVNSTADPSLNGRSVSAARWNKHYLIPRVSPTPSADSDTTPTSSFVPPDWVLVTRNGPAATSWASSLNNPASTNGNYVLGRYAYAIYDEGGLMDLNVAGYPSPAPSPATYAQTIGRKGGVSFADLTATGMSWSSVGDLVAWRNYASAQPNGSFGSFSFDSNAADRYLTAVSSNSNGFMTVSSTVWNNGTDQVFTGRQALLQFQRSENFSVAALQYLGTFSREISTPTWAPDYNASQRGGLVALTYAYKDYATVPTRINRDLNTVRVTTAFTRFDGTAAAIGDPLLKKRFPLNRLAWITYKGPSASVYATNPSDPIITALLANNVTPQTIQNGTAANIKTCFGLVWDSRAYVAASGNTPSIGQQWVYTSPNSNNGGGTFDGTGGSAASAIKALNIVQGEAREAEFFELLEAGILNGSLGQNTGGGVTGAQVFPDVHMSNTTHQLLSIGAAIIDQSDPDSYPTRIRFDQGGVPWIALGVESLPYLTEICPVAGVSVENPAQWATYLLFQLWNPNQNTPIQPSVRLRLDGGIGIFNGNGQTWPNGAGSLYVANANTITLPSNATFAPTPAPMTTSQVSASGTAPGTFVPVPAYASTARYVGFRLPDFTMPAGTSGQKPELWLQVGAASVGPANPFNATLEVDMGGGTWVPYNYFVGINVTNSWITSAPIFVRAASAAAGTPVTFSSTPDSPTKQPYCFVKSDPRSTRLSVVQLDTNPASVSRIDIPLWPDNFNTLPNGLGGTIGTDVDHVPNVFVATPSKPFYPATLCINAGASSNTRTGYADPDGVYRPADAIYQPKAGSKNAETPFDSSNPQYKSIVLNRPFGNVGELGYAFRDLPFKSLDFLSDYSADAGLLDMFTIQDDAAIVAGRINLNSRQFPALQAVLRWAVWDELDYTNLVADTGPSGNANANKPSTMAKNLVSVSSGSPLDNRSKLVATTGVPLTILSKTNGVGLENRGAKTRREAVARSIAAMSQTRTWNVLIDVIAQSGRYPPTATGLAQFVVEGEKRYWLHIAIDRFTGEIIDQQLEAVYE